MGTIILYKIQYTLHFSSNYKYNSIKMENNKKRPHLLLENAYLKYKNKKLQMENIELQNKLKSLYLIHANTILTTMDKNNMFSKIN